MLFIVGIGIAFFLDLLLVSKKGKTPADKILAAWLFIIGVHLLLFYIDFSGQSYTHAWLLGIAFPLPLLHGPFLYLYIASLTNQQLWNKKWWPLHFVPAVVCWLYLIRFFVLPGPQKIFIFQHGGTGFETFMFINPLAINISGVTYIIWSIILLRRHRKAILNQFSYTEKINLAWLQWLVYGLAAIWLAVIFSDDKMTFTVGVAFILIIGYFGIKQGNIFSHSSQTAGINTEPGNNKQILPGKKVPAHPPTEGEASEPAPVISNPEPLSAEVPGVENISDALSDSRKYAKSGLNEEGAENLRTALTVLMEKEKLFTESELSLSDLAKRLNTHPNYLSQVINAKEGKNFYDYINTLRLDAFMKLVADPANQQYTILSLAYDCGFNSKSSFNRYFKKVTGESPSDYLRKLHGASSEMPD